MIVQTSYNDSIRVMYSFCSNYTEILECGKNATERLRFDCDYDAVNNAILSDEELFTNRTGIKPVVCQGMIIRSAYPTTYL